MTSPAALVRLFSEFEAGFGKPEITLNNGIYVNKRGYHNKPTNLPASDYSLQHSRDKAGARTNPGYGSAIDINFEDARLRSEFGNIALVSKRLYVASQANDPRLVKALREWFGNTDSDREVEGWTFWNSRTGKAGPASSDSTHLFHIHLSFWRDICNNWSVVKGVLDVMLGRPLNPEPEEDMPLDANDKKWLLDNLGPAKVWAHPLTPGDFARRIGGYEADAYPAGGLQVGPDAYGREVHNVVVPAVGTLLKAMETVLSKIDALDEDLGSELREALSSVVDVQVTVRDETQ